MKTRLAMILSVSGVLAAGAAAALVNTRALSSSDPVSPSPALAAALMPASTTAPARTILPPKVFEETTIPPEPHTPDAANGEPSAPVTPPNATSRHVFQVGDSGTVIVDDNDGVLSLVSALPNAGWQVASAEATDTTDVRVVYRSDSVVVTFTVHLSGTEVSTAVDAAAVQPATATTAARVPSSTVHAAGSHNQGDDSSESDD